jgi:hypothetical protein
MTRRSTGKPRGAPRRQITEEQWAQLLRLVGTGTKVEIAFKQVGRGRKVLRRYFRENPVRHEHWLHVVKEGIFRRRWPSVLEMDAILTTLIRNPGMSARTACAQHGFTGKTAYDRFIKRTRAEPWQARYLRVKRLQRGRSFEALEERVDTAPKLTRPVRREINQTVNRLRHLEPRRLWPKKQLSAAEAALRPARRSAAKQRRAK